MNKKMRARSIFCALLLFPSCTFAAPGILPQTNSIYAFVALFLFVCAYLCVMAEEFISVRKSKPVLLAAGLIWGLVAAIGLQTNSSELVNEAVRHNLLDFSELFLFLIVAMTYVNALEERQVFEALKSWLIHKKYGYKKLFWITGILAFCISPLADNLTTALVMCTVIISVAKEKPKFVSLCCINIVVGANAGGAFSPFGDITTLMVWQSGVIPFQDFFKLFFPSLINFLIPAVCMHFAVPRGMPKSLPQQIHLAYGAKTVVILFIFTIFMAVGFFNFLKLPPVIGMMLGLSLLQFYGFYLKRIQKMHSNGAILGDIQAFDIFKEIQRIEWDTFLFFYGIMMCVGGLATFGFLEILNASFYQDFGWFSSPHKYTLANVFVGLLSACIDNIPVMFSILTMNPTMSEGQWLLVTLTAGVGGSLLSIGSAAGVALMGQTQHAYTFMGHLRWSWAILLGYIASIICHIYLNSNAF